MKPGIESMKEQENQLQNTLRGRLKLYLHKLVNKSLPLKFFGELPIFPRGLPTQPQKKNYGLQNLENRDDDKTPPSEEKTY